MKPEPRLSVVAESLGDIAEEELDLLGPIDPGKLSERLRELGESAAEHRHAAEVAQRTLESLAMHSIEERAKVITKASRDLKYRERALDQREAALARREQALAKHRAALSGLKGALGLADE